MLKIKRDTVRDFCRSRGLTGYMRFAQMQPKKATAPAARTWSLNDAINAFARKVLNPQLRFKTALG
jgi:hypothetical protein